MCNKSFACFQRNWTCIGHIKNMKDWGLKMFCGGVFCKVSSVTAATSTCILLGCICSCSPVPESDQSTQAQGVLHIYVTLYPGSWLHHWPLSNWSSGPCGKQEHVISLYKQTNRLHNIFHYCHNSKTIIAKVILKPSVLPKNRALARVHASL
jgi:hypothetical protein